MKKRDINNYEIFNKNNIHDTIIRTEIFAKGIKLVFDKRKFIFYPQTSSINNNNYFFKIAEKGDLVDKQAFKDTLTLIKKNGSVYKYTFFHFTD